MAHPPPTKRQPFGLIAAADTKAAEADTKACPVFRRLHENAHAKHSRDSTVIPAAFAAGYFTKPEAVIAVCVSPLMSRAQTRRTSIGTNLNQSSGPRKHFRAFDGRPSKLRVRRVAAAFVSPTATNPKGWRRRCTAAGRKPEARRATPSVQSRGERDVAVGGFVVKINRRVRTQSRGGVGRVRRSTRKTARSRPSAAQRSRD